MQALQQSPFFFWLQRLKWLWMPLLGLLVLEGLHLWFISYRELDYWRARKKLNQRFRQDPQVGYRLRPKAREWLYWPTQQAYQRFETDKQGFRNQGINPQRASIVLLGGSAVEPMQVDARLGVQRQLHKLLQRPVLGYGVEGWHLQHYQRAWLRYIRPHRRLRQIVVLLNEHDIRFYPTLPRGRAPSLLPLPNLPSYSKPGSEPPSIYWRCLWNFCLFHEMKSWVSPLATPCRNNLYLPIPKQYLFNAIPRPFQKTVIHSTNRELKQLLSMFRTSPTQRNVLLVWMPSVKRLLSRSLEWRCKSFGKGWIRREQRAWELVQKAGKEGGVATLNLTRAFLQKMKRGERLFFHDRPLLNARGHRFLAQQLRSHLAPL